MKPKKALKNWNIACFIWLGLLLAIHAWAMFPGDLSAPSLIVDCAFLISGFSALATLWPGPLPSMLVFFGSFILQWCVIYLVGRFYAKRWLTLIHPTRRTLLITLIALAVLTIGLNYNFVLYV